MFQMQDRRTGRARTVYGVHKSGPRDEQTKFLIFSNGWKWVWAKYFMPQPQSVEVTDIIIETVDLLVGVEEAVSTTALAG